MEGIKEMTTNAPEITSTVRSDEELSDETIFTIRLYGSITVAVVFFIGIASWCYFRKRRSVTLSTLPTDAMDIISERKTWMESLSGGDNGKHFLIDETYSTDNEKEYPNMKKPNKTNQSELQIVEIKNEKNSDNKFCQNHSKHTSNNKNELESYEILIPRKYGNGEIADCHHFSNALEINNYQICHQIDCMANGGGCGSCDVTNECSVCIEPYIHRQHSWDVTNECSVCIEPCLHRQHSLDTVNFLKASNISPLYYKGFLQKTSSLQYMNVMKYEEQNNGEIQRLP